MNNLAINAGKRKVGCLGGTDVMLTSIGAKEEKRVSEFKRQYADKWFNYVVINPDEEDDADPLVMVTHVADTKKEIYASSDDEFMRKGYTCFGIAWGENVNPEPGIRIGGLGLGVI